MVVRSSKLAAIDLDRSRMRIGLVIVPDWYRGGGRAKQHVNVLEKPCPLLAKALPPRLNADEIRRPQAHPARLQSAMGGISGQKIVFAGGQFVAGLIRQAGADQRMVRTANTSQASPNENAGRADSSTIGPTSASMSAAFSTAATVASTEAKGSSSQSAPSRGAGLAARDARIRVARATPGRCGILLHNRVRGRSRRSMAARVAPKRSARKIPA
jgi:hypothetical protein